MITYRMPEPSDIAFVYSTFLKGLRHGNKHLSFMPSKSYFALYHERLTAILQDPTTVVTVACLTDDPSVILGYSVTGPATLHCIYVKKAFRRSGIGRRLLPNPLLTVSFTIDSFSELLSAYGVQVKKW
jgi:ribosomal protein S18 acetylase RimI-like enzyme